MSDFQKYKAKRMSENPEVWEGYEKRYENFKIGANIKKAREEAGMTQEQVADKLNTNKSAISRMENHASDIKLSTLEKFVNVVGKRLIVAIE